MITANMHEAKSRLSELVKAVEERGEIIILCRNGKEVAEIHPRKKATEKPIRRLTPDPNLCPIFAPGYDPAEPASDEDWSEDCR